MNVHEPQLVPRIDQNHSIIDYSLHALENSWTYRYVFTKVARFLGHFTMLCAIVMCLRICKLEKSHYWQVIIGGYRQGRQIA
jgi:hypothetical protein